MGLWKYTSICCMYGDLQLPEELLFCQVDSHRPMGIVAKVNTNLSHLRWTLSTHASAATLTANTGPLTRGWGEVFRAVCTTPLGETQV